MAVLLCGCVAVYVWICGCVSEGLCGCVVVWMWGSMAVLLCGCFAVWLFCCIAVLPCGHVVWLFYRASVLLYSDDREKKKKTFAYFSFMINLISSKLSSLRWKP